MRDALKFYQETDPDKFTEVVTGVAPYFGTIQPCISQLHAGYCEVQMKKRREVENHIGTVHAIAICNAAELAAGTMMEASIPDDFRWIPEGMETQYLTKARTNLKVIANAEGVDLTTPGTVIIPVVALDEEDTAVLRANIRMNLKGPRAQA